MPVMTTDEIAEVEGTRLPHDELDLEFPTADALAARRFDRSRMTRQCHS